MTDNRLQLDTLSLGEQVWPGLTGAKGHMYQQTLFIFSVPMYV